MSHAARERVFKHSKTTGNWRVVMLVLAEHTNSDGLAWPGNDLIAKEANISTRTIRRILDDLERNMEIEVEERGVGRGNRAVIRITPERGNEHDKRGQDVSSFTEGLKGDKNDDKRGQKKGTNPTQKGTNAKPDLYIEPLEPNIGASEQKKSTTSKPKKNPPSKQPGRRPDSVEEVISYFASKQQPESEALKFFENKEAVDWVQGRTPLKNWKRGADYWCRNIKDFAPRSNGRYRSADAPETRTITTEDGKTIRIRPIQNAR